jgi:hypothetical protein
MNKKANSTRFGMGSTYMYNTSPDNPSEGYFAWSLKDDGTPLDARRTSGEDIL